MAKVEQKGHALSRERLLDLLREMLLVRRFEEKVEERFRAGDLAGFLHVAIGQEAVAVGVCEVLEEADVIASTHRAHAHALAKGTHPNELMAELYGKVEGCSHGYGGSMHLYDIERGNIGANAVVGGGLPAITGAALSFKLRGEPRVAVAFFGDGATNIGTFHESLNLAQLWKVPGVFVCENNGYAESTPAWQQLPIDDLSKRAVAYGMHTIVVDGQDVEEVYKAASQAVNTLAKEGPRVPGRQHVPSHRALRRRPPGVPASRGDPVTCARTTTLSRKLRSELEVAQEEWDEFEREVAERVEASVEFAQNGTDPRPEDALKNVYA